LASNPDGCIALTEIELSLAITITGFSGVWLMRRTNGANNKNARVATDRVRITAKTSRNFLSKFLLLAYNSQAYAMPKAKQPSKINNVENDKKLVIRLAVKMLILT